MTRLRTILILLLSVALVVLFAWLPQIVASVSDVFTGSQSGTVPMEALQTTLPQENPEEDAIWQLLSMARGMYTVPMDTEQATMTREEVEQTVAGHLREYYDAGILPEFEISYMDIEPFLGVPMEGGTTYFGIFWSVTLANTGDPYHYLFLHMDDATGKIIYINYETYGVETATYESLYDEENEAASQRLNTLSDIFFRQLGYSDAADYARATGVGYDYRPLDDGVASLTYSFGDAEYGEIGVTFYTYANGGFHNDFT